MGQTSQIVSLVLRATTCVLVVGVFAALLVSALDWWERRHEPADEASMIRRTRSSR